MTPFDSVVLGIVEGITEFLPISSTGHLILASALLRIPNTDYLKTFEIAIQLGAILSVVVLFWRTLINTQTIKTLLVAFIPTGVIGLALHNIVKTYLLGNESVVLWSLALGGIALIVFELLHRERENAVSNIHEISYTQAALIGLAQSIAIIPGVSRSAATIVGGMLLGVSRATIVEFSFLLAVPTMTAATGLDLLKSAGAFSSDQFSALGIGFVTSFFVALFAIKFLLAYVRKHSFIPFGVYRILAALMFFLLVA